MAVIGLIGLARRVVSSSPESGGPTFLFSPMSIWARWPSTVSTLLSTVAVVFHLLH